MSLTKRRRTTDESQHVTDGADSTTCCARAQAMTFLLPRPPALRAIRAQDIDKRPVERTACSPQKEIAM